MAINSLNSASKGLSGLASGMDTQSMVDAMLSGTQAKIDKQMANKTILGYKQGMYRDMYSSLVNFQNTFISYSAPSATNMYNSAFYNTMSAASKASAFKVTAGTSAGAGKVTINSISQLATSAKVKSGASVSGVVKGKLNIAAADDKEVQITLDGVSKTIKLSGKDANGVALTEAQFRTQLQDSINKEFGNGIIVGGTGDELTLTAADTSREFRITGNASSMEVLGLPTGVSNKVNDMLRLSDVNFGTPLTGNSYKFTINGEKFEFDSSTELYKVIDKINSSNANVKVRYSALEDRFIMESTVSGVKLDANGNNVGIEMSQEDGNLLTAMFGVAGGGNVSGSKQYVTQDIFGKLSGVTLDYKPGDVISADDATKIADAMKTVAGEFNRLTKSNELKLSFMIDGEQVDVVIPKRELTDPNDPDSPLKEYTLDDIIGKINADPKFVDKGVKFELQTETDVNGNPIPGGQFTGGMGLTAPSGVEVQLNPLLQSAFGLSPTNVREATGSDTLAAARIGDFNSVVGNSTIRITTGMTMDEAAAAIQQQLRDYAQANGQSDVSKITVKFNSDEAKGGFRVCGIDIPMKMELGGEGEKLFGATELKFNTAGAAADFTAGQNAKLVIDGVEVERNSNDFTIDGLSFELKSTYNTAKDPKVSEEIFVSRDTDKIFSGISKFVEDYNKLLESAWGKLKEDATYKEYPPLTDKQKAAMSDKEVELWEKKSQEGLLRGDDTIEAIMDSMRRALNNHPAGSKYSLADFGITTSYDMDKGIGGKLVFTDNGETLKKMIAQEPEALEKLMSDRETGLLSELNKVLTGATTGNDKNNVPKPGDKVRDYAQLSLVDIAGRPGVSDTASSIYKEVREINQNLENLNRKYKAEYQRYWKQYNAMEQIISNMNQQSSWLSQQFS